MRERVMAAGDQRDFRPDANLVDEKAKIVFSEGVSPAVIASPKATTLSGVIDAVARTEIDA